MKNSALCCPFGRSVYYRHRVVRLSDFVLFSSQILLIHQDFYKWFRDVNVGKITDMKTGFRIGNRAICLSFYNSLNDFTNASEKEWM